MVTMHGLRVHSLPCYSSAYECIAAIHLSHEALRLSPRSIIHNCQHLPYSTASARKHRKTGVRRVRWTVLEHARHTRRTLTFVRLLTR